MPYITTEVGDKTVSLGFNVNGLAGNCGANLVYGMTFNATKKSPEDSWRAAYAPMTKKELIEALDAMWPRIRQEMQTNGFILFTDNVTMGDNLFSLKDGDPVGNFKTRTFVQWLIMRGHGAVARGITSVNANHPGSSVITSWTWCPNPGRMLTLEQECYKPSEEEIKMASADVASSYRDRLGKVAEKYNKEEAKLYEETRPKIAADSGDKAPIPGTKRGRLISRTSVPAVRRRTKPGQKLFA